MHSKIQTSMQRISVHSHGALAELSLPAPSCRVPGHDLSWGRAEEIGSPTYWAAQTWMWEIEEPEHYRLGRSLREEILACLLGGYGIPAETGLAAYARLRSAAPDELRNESAVCALLSSPLDVGGRRVRYRFARQKSRYIAEAMRGLECLDVDAPDLDLRNSLMALPGIGPKTASWIVRNWRGSDDVSILDIHIIRTGRCLGIFAPRWRVERHYEIMERAYLRFAKAIGARPSILDSVIWMTMRRLPQSIVTAMHGNRPN